MVCKCQECPTDDYEPNIIESKSKQVTSPKRNDGCSHFFICYDSNIMKGANILFYRCAKMQSRTSDRGLVI
jgi:hypothetical protein